MIYAINNNNERINATETGQRAIDPFSKTEVISKVGLHKIPHWALKNKVQYYNWYEPTTEWHLNWQLYFEKECGANLEEIMYDNNTNEKHISDCKFENGVLIEVQHSPIKESEIEAREAFYGDTLIWLLDYNTMFKDCNYSEYLSETEYAAEKFSYFCENIDKIKNIGYETFNIKMNLRAKYIRKNDIHTIKTRRKFIKAMKRPILIDIKGELWKIIKLDRYNTYIRKVKMDEFKKYLKSK